MKKSWKIGTRGSKLALRQTELTIEALKNIYPDHDFSVKIIKTTGDSIWDAPLHLIGGKGLFVKEIEDALLERQIDMAIHSMKDLPTDLDDRLLVAAVSRREDPRDVFISLSYGSIKELKQNARIGTSSVRRRSQLQHFNKHIEVVNLRGNIDTRIRKLSEHHLDGIILAHAGVKRMGFDSHVKEILPLDIMVPPSGQGAIGIETRNENEVLEILRPINDEKSFFEVSVERKLQAAVGGGCQVPLGINAAIKGKEIRLHVALGDEGGGLSVKEELSGTIDNPEELITRALKLLHKN